jgi:hypothetical protein
MRRILASVFVAALAVVPASGESNRFKVQGSNPGGAGTYEGTVDLTPIEGTGAATMVFKVVYTLGSTTVEGVGMVSPSNNNVLAVAFPDGAGAGILVLSGSDDSAKGEWFAPSQTAVGSEGWTADATGLSGGAPAAPATGAPASE